MELRFVDHDSSPTLYRTIGITYPSLNGEIAVSAVSDAAAAADFLASGVLRPTVTLAILYPEYFEGQPVPYDASGLIEQTSPFPSVIQEAFYSFTDEEGHLCCIFPAVFYRGDRFAGDAVYLAYYTVEHDQGNYSLSALFIADQNIVSMLLRELSDVIEAADAAYPYETLKKGDRGNEVKKLQQKLTDLGLL